MACKKFRHLNLDSDPNKAQDRLEHVSLDLSWSTDIIDSITSLAISKTDCLWKCKELVLGAQKESDKSASI